MSFKSSPPPSPIESKRLFYTSVSLLLSHIQGYHYPLSKFHKDHHSHSIVLQGQRIWPQVRQDTSSSPSQS